ncbi:MAG TPA: type II toxin-antitoxin system VapC family toxin [Gemmatimonadales bacterium]|nr:MAG: type II toxin-antitoxin system VapC family toxin [Gammaproteobacteria bacterium]TLZ33169.1 MAG: type II toxin-antitoxin system VapC family toxin [Gammaproteobacteria bacterium]TLZ46535.1 MAG: type II toxin-antitoxin system VapC family toxin [Gammaproteobacteria bacterium]HXG96369.1 type II toxin-antitoxin system VapC family toxin [Gemmatimonadales bacterium]
MSALLLDTHIWLWYAEGDAAQLPPASVRRLEATRREEGLLVSAISVWELGMQVAKGRIQLPIPLRDWVDQALAPPGLRLLPLDAAAAVESTSLPGALHGDPADRFLIASARTEGAVLATRDQHILQYGKAGFVRVLEL